VFSLASLSLTLTEQSHFREYERGAVAFILARRVEGMIFRCKRHAQLIFISNIYFTCAINMQRDASEINNYARCMRNFVSALLIAASIVRRFSALILM